jgi:phospholipid/cholesterol/gamma-HCH transport system ATP-binding protein
VRVLTAQGISVAFSATPALRQVSFAVPGGAMLGLIGPPECGKTTLLKALASLVPVREGAVLVDGERVDRDRAAAWQSRVGMAFQNNALFDRLSVFENVAFPLRRRGVEGERVRQLVEQRLQQVGLERVGEQRPRTLSGGMQKRLAIARATIHEPELGLFDDPIAGLDPCSAVQILDLIDELRRGTAMAAIVASNDLAELLPICDRVLMLSGGRLVYDGPAGEIGTSAPQEVRQFVWGGEAAPRGDAVQDGTRAPDGREK